MTSEPIRCVLTSSSPVCVAVCAPCLFSIFCEEEEEEEVAVIGKELVLFIVYVSSFILAI